MRFLLLCVVCMTGVYCDCNFTEFQILNRANPHEEIALAHAALKLSPTVANANFCLMRNDGQNEDAFYSLTLTQEDGENIHFIIKSMAKNGWFALLKKKTELERCGDSVRHVHPLRFLGFIFSDSSRKHYMHLVKKSSIKWSRFKGGLFPNLKKEYDQGQLIPYLATFAKVVGVDKEILEYYVHRQDWDGFLNSLL